MASQCIETTGKAPSAEFLMKMLVDLLADQEGLKIECTIRMDGEKEKE